MIDYEIAAEKTDEGIRADILISNRYPEISRSYSQKLIKDGKVTINGKVIKPSYLVCIGDTIKITIEDPKDTDIIPQDIPIDIVYEDDDIIIINKGRDMVVHPSAGHEDNTLVNALMYHCKNMPVIGGETRPGIVHRIDKDTTGLLVVAKNDNAHIRLSSQLKNKTAGRKYKALVEGVIKEDCGEIVLPIARDKKERKKMSVSNDGKNSHTKYEVIERFENHTLLDVSLLTGRTHQIRVHMTHIGHPVTGDMTYGYKKQKFNLQGQMLHAYELSFIHPKTNKEVTFMAPLPDDFEQLLKKLRKNKI